MGKFSKDKSVESRKDEKKVDFTIDSIKEGFESATREVKNGFSKFAHTAEEKIHCAGEKTEDYDNPIKKLIGNLTNNLNESFKHNLTLGQNCLQCKTVSDYADLQRKFMECNFKNMMKTYSEFMHDMQETVSQVMQKVTDFQHKAD